MGSVISSDESRSEWNRSFNLIALQFGIAFICLLLVFLPHFRSLARTTLLKSILLGIILFLIFTGMVGDFNHTTASMAGFSDKYNRDSGPCSEKYFEQGLS